jgi:hypothetical protein
VAAKGKTLRNVLLILFTLLVATGVFLSYYIKTLTPRLKQRVVEAMAQRFDADVQLDSLDVSIFPVASVTGEGLTIKHKGWTDVAHPLLRIKQFHASTDYTTLLDWRNRVNTVTLEGMEIDIPPKGLSVNRSQVEANQPIAEDKPGQDKTRLKFVIETIVADGTVLEIEPKTQGKEPLRFQIGKLTMHSVGPGEAMAFTAQLMNAKPPGLINSRGHFGPWQKDDPRSTPVSGEYTFSDADLSVFNGIRGILSSTGKYGGVLQHIAVDGTTDTPDFSLTTGGAKVHLTTRFHAAVDGMNGDTILDPVDAKFLNSEFICRGGAVQEDGKHNGKTVTLDAETKGARMEDILALVVGGKPVVKGQTDFQSKIVIPPGKQQVVDKLNLDGRFRLSSAVFSNEKAQEQLAMLSDRARGISKSEENEGHGDNGVVASNMTARFRLHGGVATVTPVQFDVPGARVQLAGDYNLKAGGLDLKGTFAMQAKLSQTQSGFKEVLLKPLDRFFEKGGSGFEVPISITGTKDKPTIGVSVFHKTFVIH